MLLHLAGKALRPGAGPDHAAARRHRAQLPRGVWRSATEVVRRGGQQSRRRPCRGMDRRRAVDRASGRHPEPAAERSAAATPSRSTGSTPSSAAGAATKTGPGPRSASLGARRVRPVGPTPPARLSSGRSTTAATRPGEHVRVFPLSNWTELDVWRYIAGEGVELPSIYYAHEREVVPARRDVADRGSVGRPRPERDRVQRRRCATAPSATGRAPVRCDSTASPRRR